MREAIAKAVVQHRFGEAAKAIIARRAALASRVYDDIYSGADQKKMAALPGGWLPESNGIAVQLGGDRGYSVLSFCGETHGPIARVIADRIEPVRRRVPASHEHGCLKVYENGTPLVVEFQAIRADTDALCAEIETAERQAKAAISSASTISGLISIWPEIAPFALVHENTTKPSLPALPVQQLNALFKLPVSEAA